MIPTSDLLKVAYTVAGIAVAAGGAGIVALRLLAARSVGASLAVVSAVTVAATLAGVVVISAEMFISHEDLDVVVTVVGVAGIAGLAVALLLGRRVSAASRLMLAAVREVGRSGGYRRPQAVLPAELAGLSAELETAHGQLAEARERERALESSRRELVAWVSHDLRAPLAGLRAMAEALEDGVAADPARYYVQMRQAVERLTGMVGDLFELSRIHAGALRLSLQQVWLADLVDDAVAGAHPLAQARRVRLAADIHAPLAVRADAREMSRALTNLVVNAIRHTPGDGTVRVEADHHDGFALLTVTDACGGIPEAHLERLFDVAWRGSDARTPDPYAGAGLGLAIVRGIVEAHSGEVDVRNITGGCRFEVRLPVPAW
jgi:signal transduction histidine kinase